MYLLNRFWIQLSPITKRDKGRIHVFLTIYGSKRAQRPRLRFELDTAIPLKLYAMQCKQSYER